MTKISSLCPGTAG